MIIFIFQFLFYYIMSISLFEKLIAFDGIYNSKGSDIDDTTLEEEIIKKSIEITFFKLLEELNYVKLEICKKLYGECNNFIISNDFMNILLDKYANKPFYHILENWINTIKLNNNK